ncbi:SDR family NAD(P)-dependent oxidoreductase [Qipengyuania sp. XHP0211]|nr:SDR family NAD(P)-dependent oxidoreductase [Qipengyuania sp. XHP0211]MDG5749645.1 SDR family NAD(P)-dependent oxidoreductase [Qipengyuania sp. XHP0211]
MSRFENKTVLITGGTSGFGLEAAKTIASEGGRVAVTGHSDDHLEDAR